VQRQLLQDILNAKAQRRPVAVVSSLTTGEQKILSRQDAEFDAALENAFRFDKSGIEKTDTGERFITIHNPPLRLVITGAVLIAQSLIPMAQAAGYDVSVIDPRAAFATDARFPAVALHSEWPDEIIPKIGLDVRTAFIALTHDPKIDDPAIALALASDAFYIGALGSKKTQAARAERLKVRGFTDQQLLRICGPIGLDIGAVGAQEISISIMAQMTKWLRLGG
jgi:xanthine dehydrogenase accessory factor